MYTVVLMMALTTSGETPDCHRRNSCHGGGYGACYGGGYYGGGCYGGRYGGGGCYGGGYYGGCYGGGYGYGGCSRGLRFSGVALAIMARMRPWAQTSARALTVGSSTTVSSPADSPILPNSS